MRRFTAVAAVVLGLASPLSAADATAKQGRIGREVSVPRHLEDDEEFRIPLPELLAHGKNLFSANWTSQEGGGRPLSKGNGQALADPGAPLIGPRRFNRVSGPDANSCAGCHNAPYGIPGGGGDFVTNVFVQGQRFDFATFSRADQAPTRGAVDETLQPVTLESVGNFRATTGMFGAGYLEMLAREITADLQAIRDTVGLGASKTLVSKGIGFGRISRSRDGVWSTAEVLGLARMSLVSPDPTSPPTLVVRPWHQAGNVVSLREFSNTAFNQHHGIQSTERFGIGSDPDGDGFTNELTRADVTAVTLYQATLPAPGRVIPRDPEIEEAVWRGEQKFHAIGCGSCHIPSLPLTKRGWIFVEPSPFNPPGNLRRGDSRSIQVDLTAALLPAPRLAPDTPDAEEIHVPAFTDFKLHDITSGSGDPNAEPVDMNQTPWTPKFREGNRRFLTKRLWGCANEPPYFHHGRFTTLREAVLAHSGEALRERQAFQALPSPDQDAVIEFLKTLQVLPPGTKNAIVDENFRKREWPVGR